MSLVIGLTGENGSGKGTFIEFLKEFAVGKTVGRMATSTILGETLDHWGIPRTRRALQDLAIIMNEHYGDGTLANAAKKRILECKADIVVFDGVRWGSDEKMLRALPNSLIIYVTAGSDIRYNRIKGRKEKVGESATPKEQFLIEEKIRTELEIPEIGSRADAKIVNEGTIEEYKKKVDEVWSKIVAPRL